MNVQQRSEIEELYFELYRRLLAYARSSLRNEALAEEAVQETFRIACMKPEQLCGSPNPRGWIYNTLKFVIQNTQKAQNRASILIAEYLAQWASRQVWSEDDEAPDLLYGDVADSKEFQLLQEFVMEGKSVLELAQERNISVNACKKRLQRARETLQRKIEK